MADETANTDQAQPQAEQATENPTTTPEPKGTAARDTTDTEEVKDSHGQPGINKERHDKEVKELTDKIAELQAKLDEAAESKQGREDLKKEIDSLKAEMADERLTHKLELAGCRDVKAAKARLDDFSGDVSKLKDACPYLFAEERKTGSTGVRNESAPNDHDKRVANARKAAGLPPKKG